MAGMESSPVTVAVPVRVSYRHWLSPLAALVALVAAPWLWLFFSSLGINSLYGLQILIPSVSIAGLLLFAVVTALLDVRQRTCWLVVFVVVTSESLSAAAAEMVTHANYLPGNPGLRDLVRDQATLHFVFSLARVLAVHTLLWPLRALLGWQVHWQAERPSPKARLTIWHFAGWVALITFLVARTGPPIGNSLHGELAVAAASLAGLPALILATRRQRFGFWVLVLLGGIIAGSGLGYIVTKVTGGGSGFPLWSWGLANGTVAGTVLLLVSILRWAGWRFHLPLSRPEAAAWRGATAGKPANSFTRRDLQFSLRSLLMLTTLLCLGPGAYIAWEREQCRQGSEILARIEQGLGQQGSSYPRPPWLQAVLGNCAFRRVSTIHTKRTSFGAADLALLSGLPKLDTLLLDNTPVTDDGMAFLARVKDLQTLSLAGTPVTDNGLVHLTPRTGLWHLMLNKTSVTDAGLVHLSGLTNLRTLWLQETRLTDDGLAHLSPLVNLEYLFLDNTGVGDAGLIPLSVNLKRLGLGSTEVSDAGLVHLMALANLDYLSLDSTKVTNAGLVHLSGLTSLQTLRLADTKVTDDGLAHLSSLVNLEYLFLDNTEVGDAGLAHLSADLKWLGLANTKVTDAGLVTISRLTKLENLDLSNNSITDAGLAHLEALPSLDTLVIKNTQVTKAGAAKLNKKWPALKIQR